MKSRLLTVFLSLLLSGQVSAVDLKTAFETAMTYDAELLAAQSSRDEAVEGVGVARAPLYLRVPPGHARDWRRYCGRYDACGAPVYFVQDTWYRNVYAPRYRADHGYPGDRYDERRDRREDRFDDRRDRREARFDDHRERRDERFDGRGWQGGEHGHGHGHGRHWDR